MPRTHRLPFDLVNWAMDCHLGLCPRSDYQEASRSQGRSLHNSTGFESDAIRENLAGTDTYRRWLHERKPRDR